MEHDLWQRSIIYSVEHRILRWVALSLFLGTTACSEPFEVDRHDLIAPRILGVRHADGGIEVQIWNGWGVYHQTHPRIEWLDNEGTVLNHPANRDGESSLRWSVVEGEVLPSAVRYTDPDGGTHRATFDLIPSSVELTAQVYQLPSVEDFTLDARLTQEGTLVDGGVASDAVRIAMEVAGDSRELAKIRWMTANGVGTFLERSALETDFFRANVLMDRDELLENTAIDAEQATLFALYVDGEGGNQWTWMDLFYTVEPRIPHGNRWLIVDDVPEDWSNADPLSAELFWDEAAQDWELVNLSVDPTDSVVPDCAPVTSEVALYFQWTWLEQGYCTIEEVNGLRIALETER